jgi:3-oxoacyl-[acyl-carrier-protein] synthase II
VTGRRVVITGLGAVTPVGNDAKSTWRALVAGKSGIGPLTRFDASTYPVRIAGMVKDFDVARAIPNARLRGYLSRAGGFGAAAALEAMRDAQLGPDDYPPEEKGIALGGHIDRPSLDEFVEMLGARVESGGRVVPSQAPLDVVRRSQNAPSAVIALLSDSMGPQITTSTACAASLHSIGEAYRRIQEGEASCMLAGGYDAMTTYLDVLGFALLGALTTEFNDDPQRGSRPFDRGRSGFVLGEGSVIALLEDRDAAIARGAPVHAEIVGYAASMNAYRITDSPPDGGGAIDAMANALRDAGMEPGAIDYVVAHGTGTAGNDVSETVAIKAVFGPDAYRLAISSPKSMTGHLTAAAGGLSALVAARAIREDVVPPTINLEDPDPKLDLDYVPNVARHMPVRAALANAFAFGGTNACLILTEPGDLPAHASWTN